MKMRHFGRTGPNVGEIGLGCWQLGGSDWGSVSEEAALEILGTAAAQGTTFFDTADVYGGGRSEEMIGKLLSTRPDPVFVATKLGRGSDPGGPDNFTPEAIGAHTEASLRRLGVDALDLTQLHCIPTDVLRQGDVFERLRDLQQQGKIKHFGASVESMEEALICLEQPGLASLQIIFNIFRQKPIRALFEAAQEKGVAIIVRLPLASGLLSGKMTKDTQFGANDHRVYNRDGQAFNVGETFAGLPFEKGIELADALKAFVPEGSTMAQMALRWILDFEAVSVVIPGARNPAQVLSNASAGDLPPLGPDLHRQLSDFYAQNVEAFIRGSY